MKDNSGNKPKKEWTKTTRALLVICALLNPISLSIILGFTFFIIVMPSAIIENHNAYKNTIKIKEELDPLCKGCYYAWGDVSGAIKRPGNSEYSGPSHCLLYTDNYYFYLKVNHSNNKNNYSIIRTDSQLEKCETVATFDTQTSSMADYNSGFDSIGYFKLESAYYSFDFKQLDLQRINEITNPQEVTIAKLTRDEYMNFCGIEFGDCVYRDNGYYYSFKNDNYQLSETIIDDSVLSLIKKFKFSPLYHLSYPNNLTSIICCANPDALGYSDCLILNYNRLTNQLIDYQSIHDVLLTRGSFKLFPKIDLNF